MFIIRRYLHEKVNSNIDWTELLSKYYIYIDDIKKYGTVLTITNEINKLLDIIKSYGWVQKDPGEEVNYDDKTNNYIKAITEKLMNNNYDKNKCIGILCCNNNKELPPYYYDKYKEQIEIISFVLNVNQYTYKIVDNVNDLNKCEYIFPITSFLLNSQEEVDKIDTGKILFPTFHNFNIVFPNDVEDYENIYTLLHLIINDLEHDDRTIYKYNYIKIFN